MAPGTGTLAAGAHSSTAKDRVSAAALSISYAMSRQFDRRILVEAGLLEPGESPAVYFELIDRRVVDPAAEVDMTVKLAGAGYVRDPAQLQERSGVTVEFRGGGGGVSPGAAPAPAPAPGKAAPGGKGSGLLPAAGLFQNRSPAASVRALGERTAIQQLAAWDAPARLLFSRIADRIEAGDYSEEALARLQEEMARLSIDDVSAPDALAGFLERALAGAVVGAVKAGA
jgi:hypothetical protein